MKFWSCIKAKITEGIGVSSLKDTGKLIANPKEQAQFPNNQFCSVFRPRDTVTAEEFQLHCHQNQTFLSIQTAKNINITEEGVKKLLLNLDPNKACGPDGTTPRILINSCIRIHTSPYFALPKLLPNWNIATRLEIIPYHACLQKSTGKFLYSAVSSPQDRSKRFTHYFPDRPIHSGTISASLGSIQPSAALNARRLLVHIATTVYSQVLIYSSE